MNPRPATVGLVLLFLAGSSYPSGATEAASGAAAGFEWIKEISGEWEGSFEWSGERTGRGEIQAKYYLTGNGSAVIEDHFYSGPEPMMSSVYHLDGDDLRMTHFCAATNQPRLEASAIDSEKRSIYFSMLDITNLASPDAGHVSSVRLEFPSDNELIVEFGYLQAGETSLEKIELTRVSGPSSDSAAAD